VSVNGFLYRPQATFVRRVLFQIHLWMGVLAGTYVVLVCVTGAALVFRIDLQRALHPHLFTPGAGPQVDAATILERLRQTYPDGRISGIDAPTTARPTYLAYVVQRGRLLTLLVDPAGGHVLGELPERSFIRTLQDLHFNLLAGRTGRVINGIGAGLLLALCLTGVVIWWPGIPNWRRGLFVDFSRTWRRVIWDLHGAVGIWAVTLIAMWAVTGLSFAFPSQFRAAVNAVLPLTVARAPQSEPAPGATALAWRTLIANAQEHMPGQYVQRVIPPADAKAAFLVMFSPVSLAPAGRESLTPVHLDQYTGRRLAVGGTTPTAGDLIVQWMGPLHVGNLGGPVVRVVWLIFGLAPPVLVVTGFVMWWTRVVRPRWIALHRDRPQPSLEAPAQP
jgi:uncharacterized iron-regulated membrane protein